MTIKPEVTFVESNVVKLNSGQVLRNIHGAGVCAGRACPLHNPSEHEYRGKPLFFSGRNMLRYVDGERVVDPDDYYFAIDGKAILRNSITCLLCGSMIESKHIHDYATCTCGAVAVDGGAFYLRRTGAPENFLDTSLIVERDKGNGSTV